MKRYFEEAGDGIRPMEAGLLLVVVAVYVQNLFLLNWLAAPWLRAGRALGEALVKAAPQILARLDLIFG